MATVKTASNLAELVEALKSTGSYTTEALAQRMGVGATTVHRMLHGQAVGDEVLDKVADFAKIEREQIYGLAKGIRVSTDPKRYSARVEMIAKLLESAPADIQESFLIQVRAIIDARQKQTD